MPIVPSRQHEIHALLQQLGHARAAARDVAVARLRLLGARALEPLLEFLPQAEALARAQALRVVEGSAEPRALAITLQLCHDEAPNVAQRAAETAGASGTPEAAAVLRALLSESAPGLRRAAVSGLLQLQAAGVVEALDALLALLMDERQEQGARVLGLGALQHLPASERARLAERLALSRSVALAKRARGLLAGARASGPRAPHDTLAPEAVRARLAAGVTPAQVAHLARQLLEARAPAAIPLLHEALQALTGSDRRHGEARAAVHQALAALGSRIALYDLRERLAARPVHGLPRLLSAAAQVGDAAVAALLPSLALACPEAREGCSAALAAIVAREGLSRTARPFRGLVPAERELLRELWPRG